MKKFILTAILVGAALSACGHKAELERPAPWWGPDERTQAEREHENQEGDEASAPVEQPQH